MFKLFAFLRPYRAAVALVLVLALAQSIASLYLPRLMADIVDHGIVPGDTRQIMIYGALMLLMALVGTACAVASSYFSSQIASHWNGVLGLGTKPLSEGMILPARPNFFPARSIRFFIRSTRTNISSRSSCVSVGKPTII